MKTKPRLTESEMLDRLKAIVTKRCRDEERDHVLALIGRGALQGGAVVIALEAFESDFGYTREDPIT